jgi:hypothetical protein
MLSKEAAMSMPSLSLSRSLEQPITYKERADAWAQTCIIRGRRKHLSPVESKQLIMHDKLNKSVSPPPEEVEALTDEYGRRAITPVEKNASFANGHRYTKILMIGCGTFNDTVALATLLDLYEIPCSILATEIRTKALLNKSGQYAEFKSNMEKLALINARKLVNVRVKLGIDGTMLTFHAKENDIDFDYNIVYSFFPYSPESMTVLIKQIFISVSALIAHGAEFRIALTPLVKYDASLETANIGTKLQNFGQSLKWSENHEFFLDDYEHRRTIPGKKTYLGCRAVDIASRLFFYTQVPEVQRGLDKEAHSPESLKKIERDKRKKKGGQIIKKPEASRQLFS